MPSPETFHSSLRSCDLYDNPYNVQMQANPAIIKQRREAHAAHDSISSTQTKLEKEIFDTFKQHSAKIFSGKFFIIGQTGKYVFLIFMLPTYLFFYGIPKWLLTEAVPNIYNFTKKILSRAGSKISTAISHTAWAVFSRMRTVTDPILNFIQTKIEKVRELYHNIKQRFEQVVSTLKKAASYPFHKMNQKIVQPTAQFFQKIAQTLQSMRQVVNTLKETYGQVREFLITFPDRVAEFFQNVSEKMKEQFMKMPELLTPVITVLKKFDDKVKQWLDKASQIKNLWMDRVIYKPAAAINRMYQNTKEHAFSIANRVISPITVWINPKIERVADFSNRIKERIESVKESITSTFRNISKKISETVKKYAEEPSLIKQELGQILPQPVIAFFTPLILMSNWIVKTPFKFFRKRKKVYKVLANIKEKIKLRLVRMNQKFLSLLKRSFQQAKPKCVALAKAAGVVLRKTFQVITEMFKGAFYLLRLIFAWLKILIKQGMRVVRETCSAWLPTTTKIVQSRE